MVDKHRDANYLSHPQTLGDILKIVERIESTSDVDAQVHYLEVIRDTITRFPGMTGRGLKGKILKALSALNPRSSVDPSDLYPILTSIRQLLKSRAARRASNEVSLWSFAKRVALLNRGKFTNKQDLFDFTLRQLRQAISGGETHRQALSASPFLLRYAYNAAEQAFIAQISNRSDETIQWVDSEVKSREAAHTQAEVDFTARIVGEHMKAFIREQKEAEESGDEGGALMTPYEGILDQGMKFLVYLASNPSVITGFGELPPSAIKAIKKLTTDGDFRQAVYDQVEESYGIDLDQAQPMDSFGIGQGSQLSYGETPHGVEKVVGPTRYTEKDFNLSLERGQNFEVVEDLAEGELREVPLSTLANILNDAPKADDSFGYEGRKFTIQHVDYGTKTGLVQRTAQERQANVLIVNRDGDRSWVECPYCGCIEKLKLTDEICLPKGTVFKESGYPDTDYKREVVLCEECGKKFAFYTEDGLQDVEYSDYYKKNDEDVHGHGHYKIGPDDEMITKREYTERALKGMGLKVGDHIYFRKDMSKDNLGGTIKSIVAGGLRVDAQREDGTFYEMTIDTSDIDQPEKKDKVAQKEGEKKEVETITPEMEDWFKNRTAKHIGLVQKYARKIAGKFSELKEVESSASAHDQSKYGQEEHDPYVFISWDYKCKQDGHPCDIPEDMRKKMNEATGHHVRANPHHPEHWDESPPDETINRQDRDKPPENSIDASRMTDLAIAEMVADWMAMSEELEEKSGPTGWADKNIGKRWKFKPEQVDLIYRLIDGIWPKEKDEKSAEAQSDVEADKHRELPMEDLQIGPQIIGCPKCGGKNVVCKEDHPDTSMNEMVLECPDCGYTHALR